MGEKIIKDDFLEARNFIADGLNSLKEAKGRREEIHFNDEPVNNLLRLITVYKDKVNMRHFEVLLKQMGEGEDFTGLKKFIGRRAHGTPPSADYSPLSAAAFSRPVSTLIKASLKKGFDSSSVDPVPLMMEIFCEGGDASWIPASVKREQEKSMAGKKKRKALQ